MLMYSAWTRLPITTRQKIATDFGIGKVRPTHVANDRILDDGYDIGQLERALEVPNLQIFLATEESDHQMLWNQLIDRAEGREKVMPQLTQEEANQFSKEFEERTGKPDPTKALEEIKPIKKKITKKKK